MLPDRVCQIGDPGQGRFSNANLDGYFIYLEHIGYNSFHGVMSKPNQNGFIAKYIFMYKEFVLVFRYNNLMMMFQWLLMVHYVVKASKRNVSKMSGSTLQVMIIVSKSLVPLYLPTTPPVSNLFSRSVWFSVYHQLFRYCWAYWNGQSPNIVIGRDNSIRNILLIPSQFLTWPKQATPNTFGYFCIACTCPWGCCCTVVPVKPPVLWPVGPWNEFSLPN